MTIAGLVLVKAPRRRRLSDEHLHSNYFSQMGGDRWILRAPSGILSVAELHSNDSLLPHSHANDDRSVDRCGPITERDGRCGCIIYTPAMMSLSININHDNLNELPRGSPRTRIDPCATWRYGAIGGAATI